MFDGAMDAICSHWHTRARAAEAVLLVLGHVHRDQWNWTGSEVLSFEIA
jgi:hypothetical protein